MLVDGSLKKQCFFELPKIALFDASGLEMAHSVARDSKAAKLDSLQRRNGVPFFCVSYLFAPCYTELRFVEFADLCL